MLPYSVNIFPWTQNNWEGCNSPALCTTQPISSRGNGISPFLSRFLAHYSKKGKVRGCENNSIDGPRNGNAPTSPRMKEREVQKISAEVKTGTREQLFRGKR